MSVAHYRMNYLHNVPEYAFPRVHPHGYWSKDNQSADARKWLKYQVMKVG